MSTEKEKNELLKEYFNAIITDDVMTQDPVGNVYLGGVMLTPEEGRSLQSDAEYIKKTRLWSILTNSLIDQAHKSMFNDAINYDDMRNGKMMLYNIGVQKNIIERLIKLFPVKKPHVQGSSKGLKLK